MGVRGLFSCIRNDSDNFKQYELHNTRVVFDGMNVLHMIYRGGSFPHQFNGEYLAFDLAVEEFVENLRKCKVEPIFVFDGIHKNTKLSINIKRAQEKLDSCIEFQRKVSYHPEQNCNDLGRYIKPNSLKAPSLQRAFLDSLDRLNAHHITADREADQLSVVLAIQLKCPVVSNDSDFYIMGPYWGDVEGFAFLPFEMLSQTPRKMTLCCEHEEHEGDCFVLDCQHFLPESGTFKKIRPVQRPLFATLCGNDYMPFNYFNDHVPCWRNPINGHIPTRFHGKNERMHRLIHWLSEFGSDIARPIDQVLETFSTKEREVAVKHLFASLACYSLDLSNRCYLDKLGFSIKSQKRRYEEPITSPETDGAKAAAIINHPEQVVDEDLKITLNWSKSLVDAYRDARVSSYYCEVIFAGYIIFDVSGCEDVLSKKYSAICAIPLRRLIYSLLLQLELNPEGVLMRKLPGITDNKVTEICRSTGNGFEKNYIEILPLPASKTILQEHLYIPTCSQDPTMHAFAALFFTWMRFSVTSADETFSTSCIGLAASVCAFAANILKTSVTRKDLVSQFSSCRGKIEAELKLQPLRFDFLQAMAEMQDVYKPLCTLTAILTALNESPCDLKLPSLPIVFPSCHLAHQLAQSLSLLEASERLPTLLRDWLPLLLDTFDDEKLNIGEAEKNYTTLVDNVDKMLKDAPIYTLPEVEREPL